MAHVIHSSSRSAHRVQARSPLGARPRQRGLEECSSGRLGLAPAAHSIISSVGATFYQEGVRKEHPFDDGQCPPVTQGAPQHADLPAGYGGGYANAHFFYLNAQELGAG